MSTAAAVFSRVYARYPDALLYGTTIRPPVLNVATLDSWITEKSLRINVTLPAATIGAFRVVTGGHAPTFSAVAIVASISNFPVDVDLSLSSSGWSGGGVTTLYDGVTGSVLQTWLSAPLGINTTIQEVCGVRVLVIQDANVPPPRRGVHKN